jgi:hypothetical protein
MSSPPPPADLPGDNIYSIETLAQVTHLSHDRIVLYLHHGLIQATPGPSGDAEVTFDETTVLRLRRITFLHSEYGLNDTGLRHFAALLDEVDRLREEVRFLRG